MREFGKRLLSSALALVFAAGLLPGSVFATTDCEHTELIKGECQNCKESFAAAVGDALYETLDAAIEAAAEDESRAVVLLADITNADLTEDKALGDVYLVVRNGDSIEITDSSFSGTHEQQIIRNEGSLILNNVSVENTEGKYALNNVGSDESDLTEMTINGGRYIGSEYGVGAKQRVLMLGSFIAEGEETAQIPVINGEKADFHLEDSAIEVMCNIGEGSYSVESMTPGMIAFMSNHDYEEAIASKAEWFRDANGFVVFNGEESTWMLPNSIDGAVSVEHTEFVYDGTAHMPEITKVELYGKELTEETDYVVSLTKDGNTIEQAVDVGEYKLVISGTGNYEGTYEKAFEIKAATPVLTWEAASEQFTYTGATAEPVTKVNVKLLNNEVFDGQITYAYRANNGEFQNGLPVEVGTYEVKASVAAFGNYTGAETAETLSLTVTAKNTAPVIEVVIPEDGYVYSGKAIEPAVTVKEGEMVISPEQYEVIYADNVNVGTASVTIQGKENGTTTFEKQTVTFEIKPAVLTVSAVTAKDKAYDGTKAVEIESVTVNGVLSGDEVSLAVNGLKGELESANAGTYHKVAVPALTLSGADAGNYILTQPDAPVNTEVTVNKADLTKSLDEIKANASVSDEKITVEKLGTGMPADAGTLTYTAVGQETKKGSQVVVFKWEVDKDGTLTSDIAAGKPGDQIMYDVTIGSQNYKDADVRVLVSFGAQAVDISKITVTPSAGEFVYDGKEHKPTVEVKLGDTVLYEGTDYDVKYPSDVIKVGEKELTVTFKGNYTGNATAKYAITKAKLTVAGVEAQNKTYDGTTTATVSVTKVNGVVGKDDVKVSATGIFADKNSGSNKTVNLTFKLSGNDAGNYELTAASGTTTAKISPVTASSLSGRIAGLSSGNVNSANKSNLQSVVNQANAALADTGLSGSEKSGLSNVKLSAEDMISRVESAAAAASTESIRASADITAENVTLQDKAVLDKARSDLDQALSSYGGNYTSGEQSEMQKKKDRITGALTVISRVESADTLISALPAQLTSTTAVDTTLAANINDAKTAFDALTDYEKSLLSEDVQQKLTAAVEAAENVQPDDGNNDILLENSGGPEEGEGFKFPVWILVVAGLAAAACGGGLFWYKRRQKEEELNW